MTRLTTPRVVAASLVLCAAIAAAGAVASLVRFGASDAGLAARLERDVRHTVETQSAAVETLARRVAAEPALIARAAASRDDLGALESGVPPGAHACRGPGSLQSTTGGLCGAARGH